VAKGDKISLPLDSSSPTRNNANHRPRITTRLTLVTVSRTDGDSESDGLLLGLSGDVLVNGDGRVDSSSLEEEGSNGSAGTLGGDENDVDVSGGNDTGLRG
jgi:hypothetical protein